MPELLDRLLQRVIVDQPSGCWLYQGGQAGADGYAQIRVDGRLRYVHRVSYELQVGPIPDGHQIDHVWARGCRYRHCVNPSHLEPVLPRENFARSSNAGGPFTRGVCQRGHHQVPENVYVTPSNGKRQCRPCKLASVAESNRRIRERKHVHV